MKIFKDIKPLLGQDPHVTKYKGQYILCESQNEEKISLSYLTGTGRRATKIIWDNPQEHQVWAPELHKVHGFWFIYYSSSDGENYTHRMKVLGASSDPFGPYSWSETLDHNSWGIDMTVFSWKNRQYASWSSGEKGNEEDFPQCLYIAPLVTPVEIGDPVLLSSPEFDWELSIAAINEGPQAWIDGEDLFLLYSANASWMPNYSTGILQLIGDNPLTPEHWSKCPWPLMTNAGHGHIIDGLFVHHRKMNFLPGWQDREIVKISQERFLVDGRFNEFKRNNKVRGMRS